MDMYTYMYMSMYVRMYSGLYIYTSVAISVQAFSFHLHPLLVHRHTLHRSFVPVRPAGYDFGVKPKAGPVISRSCRMARSRRAVTGGRLARPPSRRQVASVRSRLACRPRQARCVRREAGSADNVGQKPLKRTNAKIALLQRPDGLRGGATA